MWSIKTSGLSWHTQLHYNVGPSVRTLWSFKAGGFSWQWSLKTGFTELLKDFYFWPFRAISQNPVNNHPNDSSLTSSSSSPSSVSFIEPHTPQVQPSPALPTPVLDFYIYLGVFGTFLLCGMCRNCVFSQMAARASRRTHAKLFSAVMTASATFFHRNSPG